MLRDSWSLCKHRVFNCICKTRRVPRCLQHLQNASHVRHCNGRSLSRTQVWARINSHTLVRLVWHCTEPCFSFCSGIVSLTLCFFCSVIVSFPFLKYDNLDFFSRKFPHDCEHEGGKKKDEKLWFATGAGVREEFDTLYLVNILNAREMVVQCGCYAACNSSHLLWCAGGWREGCRSTLALYWTESVACVLCVCVVCARVRVCVCVILSYSSSIQV